MTGVPTHTPEDVARWRKAIAQSQWINLPDGRTFQIMWRLYEQFGARHPVTGEQYAFSYEQAIELKLVPLIMCPIDISAIELP